MPNENNIEAVKYLEPGDYIAYIKVFDACSSIEDCLIYSPFENGFNILIGFLREYLNLNGFDGFFLELLEFSWNLHGFG